MNNRTSYSGQYTRSDSAANALVFLAGFAIGSLICMLIIDDRVDDNSRFSDSKEKETEYLAKARKSRTEMKLEAAGEESEQAMSSFFGDVLIQPS